MRHGALPLAARTQLAERGYCEIAFGSRDALLSAARELGEPEPARAGGELVQELRPVAKRQANKRSLSALYGTGSFPMHTDGAHTPRPPRFLVFRCVNPGSGNRPTLIADSTRFNLTQPTMLLLRRAVFVVNGGIGHPFLASLLTDGKPGEVQVRYDAGCMKPAHLSFDSAVEALAKVLDDTAVDVVRWKRDAGLIVDNWRCLHARGVSEREDGDRFLERVTVAAT